MSEIGFGRGCVGPFNTEKEAWADAKAKKVSKFVTGRGEDGWYWVPEEDYFQLGGNKLIGVNKP